MRIVGGRWAGVSLVSPGARVRPTVEELRDLWISSLEGDLPEARVLDLFAGTGALGLEALSRGAASVDFVESGPPALHALKANISKLRVRDRTRLFKKDVFAFIQGLRALEDPAATEGPGGPGGPPYDIALADPPYTSRAAQSLAGLWLESPFSRILCVEHAADLKLPGRGKRRIVGESAVTTYRIRDPRRRS